MNDTPARAVTPIDTKKVQPIAATVPQPQHERSDVPAAPPAPHDPPSAATSAPGHRTTDLAYQVDAESKRISVHVLDRETGAVVRSFPLFMPGQGHAIDGEGGEADAPRGALVDAKA